MKTNDEQVRDFFLLSGIIDNNDNTSLGGILIERETLLCKKRYDNIKNKIPELRELYSSSFITSLHKNAETKQKWPLINIVRQILKINGYKLKPFRKSNGYDDNGKKKIIRYFKIEKTKDKS